jgi:DNA-binding transcriptional LysR family regulator
MDNLLFDIRPPDKIVERAMVIRVAVSPAYCSVTRGIRARAAVESLLGLAWNRRSLCCGIRARFAVESAFGLAWNTQRILPEYRQEANVWAVTAAKLQSSPKLRTCTNFIMKRLRQGPHALDTSIR